MDPIEKAIRNALEKGNALDTAFRQRVYVSAEHALSRSLAAHNAMAPAEKHARIEKLRRIAASIEQEFLPAEAPTRRAAEPSWSVQPERPVTAAPKPVMPPVEKPRKPLREAPEDLAGVSVKSNRRLARLLIFVTFFALAVMLGWLFWTSGILDKPDPNNGNPATDPMSESSGDTAAPKLGTISDAGEGWISVFMPSDAASLELAGGVSADIKGTGPAAFVLLTPPQGAAETALATIEVGKGLLEKLRGKKVVFDIRAKANDEAGAQMSVACDLAGMGECQRTRFRMENQLIDNLVSVQLSDVEPEASGLLTISPDIEGKGNAVEIHSVRVRIAEE